MAVDNKERLDIFKKAMQEVSGKKGVSTINFMPEIREDVEMLSSGSLVLDSILGGGLGKGRVIEFYGENASGKTSIALTAIGKCQANGGNCVFLDAEQAFDPVYAKKLGVDIQTLGFSQSIIAEDALSQIIYLCETNAVDMIVLDSVASLIPKQEDADDLDKSNMALLARLMSKALKKIVKAANNSGCTVIFLNQTRSNVGVMYGPQTDTAGGKALKFYATQRIEVKRKGIVKDGDDAIGTEVLLKCTKNKVAPPYGEGSTVLTFSRGIDTSAETKLVAEKLGILQKTGRTVRFITDKKIKMPEGAKAVYEDDNTIKIATSDGDTLREIQTNEPLRNAINERVKAEIQHRLETGGGFVDETIETPFEPKEK